MVKKLIKNTANHILHTAKAVATALLLMASIATTSACQEEEQLPPSTPTPSPTATTIPHNPDSVGELAKRLSEKSGDVQIPPTEIKARAIKVEVKENGITDNMAKPQMTPEPPENSTHLYRSKTAAVIALLSISGIAASIYLIVRHKRNKSGQAEDEQRSG